MAKQLSHVVTYDSGGSESYPFSYWRVSALSIQKERRSAEILFLGFPSAALKGARSIGSRSYVINGEVFDVWFSPAALAQAGKSPYAQAYLYADQCRDQLASVQPTPTDQDPIPAPVYESFFAGATDV